MVPIRQSADARRASILRAAIVEFAKSGYAGTSTEAIATTGRYLAAVHLPALRHEEGSVHRHVRRGDGSDRDSVHHGGRGSAGRGRHGRHGAGLHRVAAGSRSAPGRAARLRRRCRRPRHRPRLSGHLPPPLATGRELRRRHARGMRDFFAHGMLCSVLAAIDLMSVAEPWAQSFFEDAARGPRSGRLLQKMGGRHHVGRVVGRPRPRSGLLETPVSRL